MAVTLTSVSPSSGPPGTAITCAGAGFDAGSRVGCPTLVGTTLVDAGTLQAEVPADLVGADGSQIQVGVFVMGADGSVSAVLPFTVQFSAVRLQSWTTVAKVVKAVPRFQRGGDIRDEDIQGWIEEVAQEVAAAMVKRGLSLDPTQWPPAAGAFPTPEGLLEMINRAGAGATLAAAIASNFSNGPWAVQTGLQKQYERQLAGLRSGDYDKIFRAGAATVESGPQFGGGNTADCSGRDEPICRKEQVF
jgi:hypothetical protein